MSIPSAHLTCNWNFPQISWVSTSHELSDKTRFATYVRTIGTYSTAALAFVSLFEKFNWKRVGLLHVDKGIFNSLCMHINERGYEKSVFKTFQQILQTFENTLNDKIAHAFTYYHENVSIAWCHQSTKCFWLYLKFCIMHVAMVTSKPYM